MILSLGDVISMATRFAGRSDFSTSEVSLYANLAITEITTRVYHKSKEFTAYSNITGTGNERTVDVPVDFDGAVSMVFYSTSTTSAGVNQQDDKFELIQVDAAGMDSRSSTSGTPERYCVYADFIELDPIPDSRGSLVMRYLAKQPTLVVSTDTPFLDERWHRAWVDKTEELVHRSRGNHQAAADAERRYINYMTSTPIDRDLAQRAKTGLNLWLRKSM